MKQTRHTQRGSALLIVLGLLSFLLISAVAFSISMRTESSAAASYRRSLLARELLVSAFSDARASLEQAMRSQLQRTSFNRDNPSSRTAEALAPFHIEGTDDFGRLIASAADDDGIAYLLDDAVMRHVPPYIAHTVYDILEMDNPAEYIKTGNPVGNYTINQIPAWRAITASIPRNEDADEIASGTVSGMDNLLDTITVGRMAWSVINLSDALDINAIGSNSAYRGLGLTGSEFAFGSVATNSTVDPRDKYNLLKETTAVPTTAASISLPTFCSNADLAQYAARSNSQDLVLDDATGDISPYSWEEAIANEGDGCYSPFAVYSFWPHPDRKDEKGGRATSGTEEQMACSDVKEGSFPKSEIEDLSQSILGSGGGNQAHLSFTQLLQDYIDKDSELASFESGAVEELYNNAMPTVENVPMVSEIGFDFAGWSDSEDFIAKLTENVEKAVNGIEWDGGNPQDSMEDILEHMGDEDIVIDIPDPQQSIAVRAYFPGAKEATDSYEVGIHDDSFVSILGSGSVDETSPFDFEEQVKADKITASGDTLDVPSGSDDIFYGTSVTPGMVLKGKGGKIKIKGAKIPVVRPAANADPNAQVAAKKVTLSFLVDFFFRVEVKGADIVDLVPVDRGDMDAYNKENAPNSVNERFMSNVMAKLDSQFLRITRPVSVTFALKWKIQEERDANNVKKYTAITEFVDANSEPKATCDTLANFKISGKEVVAQKNASNSIMGLSPEQGAWYAIDPRYNWLSPMMGVSDNFSSYCGTTSGSVLTNLSSPHWIFQDGGEINDSNTQPSKYQEDYAKQREDEASGVVPFSWGLKVEDIRYGYNDAGQLLLPAEIGFLPVPLPRNTWTPTGYNSYKGLSVSNYNTTVANRSFFRTLPVTDLKDNAMSANDYDMYARLVKKFKSFGGENFPEEHRGIVSAFAGQDDYLLAQRLRQFAMLGIPPSIKQAAYISYQRLSAAKAMDRVSAEMVDSDLQALSTLNIGTPERPKYDEFVTDFLFPLPDTRGGNLNNSRDWEKEHTLYKGNSPKKGLPTRPKTVDFILGDETAGEITFAERLQAYNETKGSTEKLGQNDMTTLLAIAKECFGDRQQLFLFVMRADAIKFNHNQRLSEHTPLSTARAVALVWRDAYGELPDRVIYYQYLP